MADPEQLSDEQWQEIEERLFAGRKIEAIKLFRTYARVDLKDAKQIIDEHQQGLRRQFPDRFTKTCGSGCSAVVLAAFAAVTLLGAVLAYVVGGA